MEKRKSLVRYAPEVRARAVRIVLEHAGERPDQRRHMFAAVGAAGVSLSDAVAAHLRELGASAGTQLTVLTDGEEGLHYLCQRCAGRSLPVLDWFHLAMREQHVKQAARSLSTDVRSDARATAAIQKELERLRWRLWHGKKQAVQTSLDRLTSAIRSYKSYHRGRSDAHIVARKLWGMLLELKHYTNGQCSRLVNYGARYRAGQPVSTSVVESTVNALVNRRMNKRQQMRWSPAGAHQLLQVRAASLNGTLDLDRLDKRQSIATANENCGLRLAA